ncbi:cupin domain-containing protein [Actinoallomurus acaciae]|uniref:Cupin domain-containing protein n=1 Tax=Actinoallomurus acaciae TaxID=502577 RepID=A0ABV5Y7Q5_9ACTN
MSSISESVLFVRGAQAEVVGRAPSVTRLLTDGGATGETMSAIHTTMGSGVDGPPPHYHSGSAEIFFIIGGGLQVLAGERIFTAVAGDFLVVPPLTPHAFRTPDDTGADLLIIKPTAERFEYFRLVDRVVKGQASPAEILDNQDRFDNHFVESKAWHEGRGNR